MWDFTHDNLTKLNAEDMWVGNMKDMGDSFSLCRDVNWIFI